MATPAQIHANRLNSLKSTGPASAEGKAATRFNAFKHGADAQALVIPGEDAADLENLAADYQARFQPVGPVEISLLHTIVQADWNLRRYERLEAGLLNTLMANLETPGSSPLGAAFLHDAAGANALQKLFRRQQAARRDWNNALAELSRLQEDRLLSPPPRIPRPAAPRPCEAPAPLAVPIPPSPKGQNWLGSEPPSWRL